MKPTPPNVFEINNPPGDLMEDLRYLQWNPRTVAFVPTKKIVYFLQNKLAEYGQRTFSSVWSSSPFYGSPSQRAV